MATNNPDEQSQATTSPPQTTTASVTEALDQLTRTIPAKRQQGMPAKRIEDMDPVERKFLADAKKVLIAQVNLSSADVAAQFDFSLPDSNDGLKVPLALQQKTRAFVAADDMESLLYLHKLTFPSPIPEKSDLESDADHRTRIAGAAPIFHVESELKKEIMKYLGVGDTAADLAVDEVFVAFI